MSLLTNANEQTNMELTENKLLEVTRQMSKYAGEAVTVEQITGAVYVFASELATLRIFKKYCDSKNISQGYSENLKTHYFRIELNFSGGDFFGL